MYYISAGQTSLLQVQWEITLGRVLYVVIAVFCVIPEIRKGNEIDSVAKMLQRQSPAQSCGKTQQMCRSIKVIAPVYMLLNAHKATERRKQLDSKVIQTYSQSNSIE